MRAPFASIQKRLKAFDFKGLFTQELMWNHFQTRDLEVKMDGVNYALMPVAERGMAVFECVPPTDAQFPNYGVRRKIDTQVSKTAREHIIIFRDHAKTIQVWQWVKREAGKHSACREQVFNTGQSGDALIQKIQSIAFSVENDASVSETVAKVGAAFDIEKVTKKFYELFKKEHDTFLKFTKGIPDEKLQRWYASVMLNRLMFIYFIQKKGFLGDLHYLTNKLVESQQRGADKFYREFLCPLFFEGFAKRDDERSVQTNGLLGRVPYLNGGLFLKHDIEKVHGKNIDIRDNAFERIFAFFERFDWQLDDRPSKRGDEINPDVLGYVFEKYINQKEMGAYYTKEDITGYISRNTILPSLFEIVRKSCPIAFESKHSVWQLLKDDPDRYIYPSMLKGMEKELPNRIAVGLGDVTQRIEWSKLAEPEYALLTETSRETVINETWRDVVARRMRCEEIRRKLSTGEIGSIDDIVTYNLDICRFAEDVITDPEKGQELIWAFYKALSEITVLDPACGSGAFLFAALNLLEPLYDACIDRMRELVDALDDGEGKHHPEKLKHFREVLSEVNDRARHPSRRYFILKSIILKNIFGVDIMEEAVEICKLRLFLKLVAQVGATERIEPLPDIDFNIRAGNTLVGYATEVELDKALSRLGHGDKKAEIEEKAEAARLAFERFRQEQVVGGTGSPEEVAQWKADVKGRLDALRYELDDYLAGDYNVKKGDDVRFRRWRDSHQPFHWFVEFFGILRRGGFDAVIGNPPWREYSATKKEYAVRNYLTEKAGNLYALFIERSLLLRSKRGAFSFIVQLPLTCSSRMAVTRDVLRNQSASLYIASFADRPGKLFEGMEHCRAAIINSLRDASRTEASLLFCTKYHRWPSAARQELLSTLRFVPVNVTKSILPDRFPKLPSEVASRLFAKIGRPELQSLGLAFSKRPTDHFIFYQESTEYWVKATVGLPYYRCNGKTGAPPHGRYLYFHNARTANAAYAILNSSVFYSYFVCYGDCFHLSDTLVSVFPVPPSAISDARLADLGGALLGDVTENAEVKQIKTKSGDKISYAEFFGWKSKNLIDQIDARLASLYGLADEELDFTCNFDAKFRLAQNDEANEEEAMVTTN
jgi:hypothetical protein